MEDTSRQKPQNNKQHASPTFGKKSLESIVGKAIKVKTAFNEDIEGLVYTYDRTTNCIVIDSSPQPSSTAAATTTTNTTNTTTTTTTTSTTTTTTTATAGRNLSFRIIKISHIKEIISLGEGISHKKDYLPVNQVHVDRLKHRESEAVKGFQSQVSKMGVGVTKEGHDIFEALNKTLPCIWSKDTIIVLDDISITPPYRVDNCTANPTYDVLLAQVKKVLEGERKRLAK